MEIKDNYSQNINSIVNKNINEKTTSPKKIKNDILYALISIYYYEKLLSLNNKKELIFDENKTYYLINPNWKINFKKFYNYQILSQILKPIKLKDMPITYYNFQNIIPSLKDYLSQNNFSLKNVEIPDNLMINISACQKKINNLVYYPYCYIIDMKIMNIIQNYVFQGNKLKIYGQKVFAKDNSIYLKFSNKIIIGNLDRNFIFISNYVLLFNSSVFLLNEKSFLLKYSFSDYLKFKHIAKFNSNKLQLKDENNTPIGEIMIIPNNKTTNKRGAANSVSSRKKIIETKSNGNLDKSNINTTSNLILNNITNSKNIKINIFKQNNRKLSPQNSINSRKNYINQNQSNGAKDRIFLNDLNHNEEIKEFALNDESLNLFSKDGDGVKKANKEYDKLKNNFFIKINPPQNKKIENQLKVKNDTIKEDFDLKQEMEDKKFQILLKEINELQKQMKSIKNDYINKFNNLEKKLENKNKENNDLKEKIYNMEELNRKEEEKFIKKQKIINKENELNKKEIELIAKQNHLNDRENIILRKENEFNKKQNNLNEKEKNISIKQKEIINKENELNERNKELCN